MSQIDIDIEVEEKIPTILVVDDTPANLQLMVKMLTQQNYKVRVASSGQMAIKAITSSVPDLIMLDINMPGMDGYELCGYIKENKNWQDIPVIFISAMTETNEKLKAFQLGGVDYVTKPFQFEEVEARVRTHLKLFNYQKQLEQMVDEKVKQIAESQMGTIYAMAKLSESRDDDTGYHLERVRETCRLIAQRLFDNGQYLNEVDPPFIRNIYHASVLHDIGKVGVPDRILLKPGKLTAEEFEIMKSHSLIGAETLRKVAEQYSDNDFINIGIGIAHHHHEKYNGSGYPDQLNGEEIPLAARIVALADVYDALRSKRIYKDAYDHNKSCEIILEGKGTHFDPALVETFLSLEDEIISTYLDYPM